ncbi:MAG TPA: CRTAC1 family protein [Verrucomicrobiota bacterium]|nr:hypothetical protein [Verrucomicrobiales bacterium]HRI13008.1 CRTAC1 family protein [Verrucomicrobiota bacterium]
MNRALPLLLTGLGLASGCGRVSDADRAALGHPTTATAQWFRNVTSESGVAFTHHAGTNYWMPDQVGSGVALLDFNQDGRLDLYLVQNGGDGAAGRNQLFQQDANGLFHNVSEGSGADLAGRGMGAIAGDVNNDGRPDLVVTEYGAVRLLENLGAGKFREAAPDAGLDNPRWAVPASFLDYDRDGWLDLVVGNYVDYDPTQTCTDTQGRQDFCAPAAFGATSTRLWRNVTGRLGGLPRFQDATETSGLTRAPGVALGLVCADFDGDGWPDIFCADDGRANRLFVNQHDGTFREEAAMRGLALNYMGRPAANMGTAFADCDADGLPELFVTHLTEEFHSLYRQDRRGLYLDVVAQAGLSESGWRGTGFGVVLADFNCDGAPDLAQANGLVRRAVPGQTPVASGIDPWWARYAQRSQLFENDGAGHYRDISAANGGFCGEAMVGRSLAVGDLDGDGAPDLVIGSLGGPVRIYRNVTPRGHWLAVSLIDPARGGRDVLGAEAVVRAGGRPRWAVLQPATGYLTSHEPALHFGLGTGESFEGIEVRWPDGTKELFPGGAADKRIVISKGTGSGARP